METREIVAGGRSLGEEEGGGVISGAGEARTILLLLHIISAKPSKQPLMVRTFLKAYMELGSYFVSARTNKRHHHHLVPPTSPALPWSSAQPTRGTSSHTFRWIFCGAGELAIR